MHEWPRALVFIRLIVVAALPVCYLFIPLFLSFLFFCSSLIIDLCVEHFKSLREHGVHPLFSAILNWALRSLFTVCCEHEMHSSGELFWVFEVLIRVPMHDHVDANLISVALFSCLKQNVCLFNL